MTDLELLRKFIAEPDTTNYSDVDLAFYLGKWQTPEAAAHKIWLIKAGAVQSKMDQMKVQKLQVGSQSYEYIDLQKQYDACSKQADVYAPGNDLTKATSRILTVNRPSIFADYGG